MLWQTERLEWLELLESEIGFFDIKELKMLVISAFDKEIQDKTHQKKEKPKLFGFGFGRGRRIRTRDPRFWRPVLYQLSYTPVFHTRILYHTCFYFARLF